MKKRTVPYVSPSERIKLDEGSDESIFDAIYYWLLLNLPLRLMYKQHCINRNNKMWLPRFGWSKKQISDALADANKLMSNIKWR